MFQKDLCAADALSNDVQATASNVHKTEMEDSFERLRRQQDARKNRATANQGMFYRKSRVYRHV